MNNYNGGDLYDIAAETATDDGYTCEDCNVLATQASPCDCEATETIEHYNYNEIMRG